MCREIQRETFILMLTAIRTAWWRHSRSAETCRRPCIYCVHISAVWLVGLINCRHMYAFQQTLGSKWPKWS